ncbi:protein-serine/threonine phosphatase [Aspergillus clavatus NRRL 1]|uniref:RNA polymerase II subunit A C-terminal domain phosphatase n=1 Tax=Aspergillus clavatus (strain ATCC 1007 / CBS 513.65 / DSM 816 / NCTC 3887 / NRRL 1 / QM 1276 / 107) TaxID=344612 RepID=A1CKP2_ASPCL|nr:RNA Polymerase II CTD phosphatase Fcp1, putative [Aspergillus clavatus NRRL 1]EAW09716.1 RNA Polymerase II CTD phosphatase Fcp1, putative [Aspergillus clavatus NRRL 1]
MLLRLPPSLHYPITVTSLLKQPGDTVERDEALFWYVYQTTVTEGDGLGNKIEVQRKFPTKFESAVDGEIVQWKIAKGDVIQRPIDVVEIDEPCAHEVQFGGLCAECGKDMTEATYNTEIMDSMRAPIQMVHDNTSLTVSEREATRVEEDAKRRLLANKKLSLVVDLDQTIIHATVDPTVREWMEDKDNPNHEALSDVRAFQLVDDGPGMRGCWYYVKLRPGLESFLQNVAELFELHIYTMGTRAYAQHIAAIIDPDRKLFGDRILSRDESGSLTAKNLQRLFPVDTKMVVIIDDRGDVWRWSPNLIKVSPYDFFVGIGDINSSFLPKKQELGGANKPTEKAPKELKELPAPQNGNGATEKDAAEVSTLEQLVTMGGGDDPRLLQEQSVAQEETIMHQVEDRPLLQKQKELDAEEEAAESSDSASSVDESQDMSKHRHHLLEDNDRELFALEERLEQIHKQFFEDYDRKRSRALGGRVAALRGEKTPLKEKDIDLKLVPDVKDIMPRIKHRVLGGVVLVFSGVLPLGTDTQNADISLWTKSFGAVISTKINRKTTHLVAGRNRTAKVREATRYPNIKIVTTQWLLDTLTQWKRLDEEPYLLPVHPDDRGEPISPGSKELESGWLSSSEEGTGGYWTDDEDSTQDLLKSSGLDEMSPIGYDAEEQAAVHDELKEFLGSDNESESDSEVSTLADEAGTSGKKRKRDEDSEGTSEGEADSSKEEEGEKSRSRLAQRIKRSYERTTSLKEVASADSTSMAELSHTSLPTERNGGDPEALDEPEEPAARGQDVSYPEDPVDDDDELEREMLAALEDGGYDAKAEEGIAAENG